MMRQDRGAVSEFSQGYRFDEGECKIKQHAHQSSNQQNQSKQLIFLFRQIMFVEREKFQCYWNSTCCADHGKDQCNVHQDPGKAKFFWSKEFWEKEQYIESSNRKACVDING